MVFLLYCVSTVMVLGGGALAFYGAENIRTESGATLALAGVALFCCGFVLLALAAVLKELRRLRRVVEEPEPAAAPVAPAAPPPPLPSVRPPAAGTMPPPPPGMTPPPGEPDLSPAERLRRDKERAASRDDESGSETAKSPEATVEADKSAERTLTATYASNGNTFYMYSDGTIETDTPEGRRRFGSMDELRRYVESGVQAEPAATAER
ncbi:hypothetical protein NK718_04780 [Alsobacter sp. SYSU M60028]|uniref:DUF308 domain-containing protein n=1 Tax=Alsobacter ponti TaxID=2962936 RepID=A0ABT1LAM1_9HYPH|nr:hypothetical protein [Alsobacter ponti]MCP8937820.1 hypothetical protein [Alsobacter ponti]